jgi:hypothetical protein
MTGLVVTGNVCTANRGSGIVVNSGTLSPIVGRDGEVGGNVCTANGEVGVLFDTTLAPGGSTYAFRGNRCDCNGKAGIKVVSDARRDLTGIAIVDNDIHGNGSLGVHVVTAGAWVRNVTISSNRVSANGQINTAGYTQAIRIDAPTERFTSPACSRRARSATTPERDEGQSSQSADSTGFAHSWRHTMKSGSHGSRPL